MYIRQVFQHVHTHALIPLVFVMCAHMYMCLHLCTFAGEGLTMKKLQDSMEQSSDDADRDSDNSDTVFSGSLSLASFPGSPIFLMSGMGLG